MATTNFSELYCACRDGDVNAVKRLLPLTPLTVLNRLEPNRSSCLHVACWHDHTEIARLLLAHGSCRRLNNVYGCTPLDIARTEEIIECFRRPKEAARQRFAANPTQQIEWFFYQDKAEAYARIASWGCVKDRGLQKTVQKIEDAEILPKGESEGSKLVRFYFDKAKEENNPLFLLQAYTVESPFYVELNKYMAIGNRRKVWKRLCHKWSGYYAGTIMKNPVFEPYYFSGNTYQGMEMASAVVEQYKPGLALATKVFQSTLKSKAVALTFACPENRKTETIPVIINYKILDRRSALDLTTLSEYQDEEEVLIVPATLFKVTDIDKSREPFEFKFEQIVGPDQ